MKRFGKSNHAARERLFDLMRPGRGRVVPLIFGRGSVERLMSSPEA
jgi:hypothetical protein